MFHLTTVMFTALMLAAVFGLVVILTVWLIMNQRNLRFTLEADTRLKEQANALKRDMLAKGLSAEEIERIIKAAPDAGARSKQAAASGPEGPGFDKARLVQILLTHEMAAEDIERLLRALAAYPDEELPGKVTAVQSMVVHEMEAEDIERVIRAFHRDPGLPNARPAHEQTSFRE